MRTGCRGRQRYKIVEQKANQVNDWLSHNPGFLPSTVCRRVVSRLEAWAGVSTKKAQGAPKDIFAESGGGELYLRVEETLFGPTDITSEPTSTGTLAR
jgi:hypothetical protein